MPIIDVMILAEKKKTKKKTTKKMFLHSHVFKWLVEHSKRCLTECYPNTLCVNFAISKQIDQLITERIFKNICMIYTASFTVFHV